MEQSELSQLVNKYLDGNSTNTEESRLLFLLESKEHPYREIYLQIKGMQHLKLNAPGLEDRISSRIKGKSQRQDKRWFWLAATLITAIGLMLFYANYKMDNVNKFSADDMESYQETKKALSLLSKKFNNGTAQIEKFSKFHESQIKIIGNEN